MKKDTERYLDRLRWRLDVESIVWRALHLRYWSVYRSGMNKLNRRKLKRRKP